MQKSLLIVVTSLLMLTNIQTLSAMTIGREGSPFIENNVEWQMMSYQNNHAGFKALLPGSPRCGFANGDVYTYSQYQNIAYEVHCSLNNQYQPPKHARDFQHQLEEAFVNEATIQMIDSNQKLVKYAAEIYFTNSSKVVRVYSSKNCLYWAIVQGNDLSLAPIFFDSIEITK